MGAVAQVASCASNLAYLIVFRSKKTREAAHKTFSKNTCSCKRRVKRIGKTHKAYWARRLVYTKVGVGVDSHIYLDIGYEYLDYISWGNEIWSEKHSQTTQTVEDI